jgi:hypothetical protein
VTTVSFDVSEVRALARDIYRNADEVPAKGARLVAAMGHRTAAAIQSEIRRLDLIDTSFMLNTTSVDVEGLHFEAGPEAEYAIYQDQGTSELPANNFTGRGFDLVLPQAESAAGDLGEQIIGRD